MSDTISVIRDRYQLTIPEAIRRELLWTSPRMVVKVILVDKEKILLEPYQTKVIKWQEIFMNLDKIRSWGKKISLAEFVVADRETH